MMGILRGAKAQYEASTQMQAEAEALRMIGLAGNIHAALKGAGRGGLPLVPGRPRRASSTVMVTGCRVAKVVIVSAPLAMGVDPGDDFWPDVCACLAPDHYSEMLQPNPNLAWILNDTHTRCWRRVDKRFD